MMLIIKICLFIIIVINGYHIRMKMMRKNQRNRISLISDMLKKRQNCRFVINNVAMADAEAVHFYEDEVFANNYFIEDVDEKYGIIRLRKTGSIMADISHTKKSSRKN